MSERFPVNPGMAFLHRATCRFELVEAGEMTVEEALMGLAPAFYELVHPMCECGCEIFDRMERLYPHVLAPPKYRRVL